MAEPPRAEERYGTAADAWRTYRMVAAMWIRSTLAYRASFALTLFSSFCVTFFDFVVILLMFGQVQGLGGFSFAEVAFLYGTTGTAFGIADLALGSLQRMGRRIRDGSLDVFLLRPAPLLAQVAADTFALRRLGRVLQGLMVLVWSLVLLRDEVAWTWGKTLMVPGMVGCGAVIFMAVMVLGASALFWLQDAAEVTNSFTYGGNTLLQYPPTVFAQDLVKGVVFVVPLAFVNWLPALYVLGRPAPAGVPSWAAFASPLVALVCCAVAGLAWRAGVRSYRSTGS
ncbi:ABC transporter permease [Streptomyces sp. NPDC088090]|uniref:ABC transporter permease n=1 Tax=Streptomyces sp. NPDC088090 TaxID=3365822 RepID=UPI00384FA799